MSVSCRGSNPWFLTVCCMGVLITSYVMDFGIFLKEVGTDMNDHWAVGDFNSLLNDHERNKGPTKSSVRSMRAFKNTVSDCDLIDAGFQGYPYTWHHGDLEERLDRLLINIQWRLRFPDGVVYHLPPFKSDHRPLLV